MVDNGIVVHAREDTEKGQDNMVYLIKSLGTLA